ncbi:MAG: hypothetical protein M1819_002378 [Sarea resinae]|nr:MAG: hypothetical protein M1819_002378 [Sarea resinae]
MGKLIKNHLARLVVLTAAAYQFLAGLHGIFWPKILFDWLTTTLNGAVKPVPILQIINIILALFTLALEWPVRPIAGTKLHSSTEFRLLVVLPVDAIAAVLLYQGTNAALYYVIGMTVYFWGFCEGESICAVPWTLPRRGKPKIKNGV